MAEYKFHIDSKMTVWSRSHRTISADSEKDAKKIAKETFTNYINNDDGLNDYETSIETLYDTQESMSVDENGGASTEELLWEGVDYNILDTILLMDNRPVGVVRDEKLSKIFPDIK